MIGKTSQSADDHADDEADIRVAEALSLEKPKSFMLYAGAGSGKTRSLKNALDHIREHYGESLRKRGRKVGVITYTNAARDEILRRVEFDPLFHVATIHSFAWTLIEGHTEDIKAGLQLNCQRKLLKSKQRKPKAGLEKRPKIEREKLSRSKRDWKRCHRLKSLSTIRMATTSPETHCLMPK